jgi:hypothetical protein
MARTKARPSIPPSQPGSDGEFDRVFGLGPDYYRGAEHSVAAEESAMATATKPAHPTPETALEKPEAMPLVAPVPAGLPFAPEEWAAMSEADRAEALAMWQDETKETTRGVRVEFPRVKYPTSGSSFWEIPTATGEPDAVKTIEGIVVFKMPVRAYWPLDAEVGNNPPTCASRDSLVPDPESPEPQARTCAACPRGKFGTGKEGRGQACKQRLNVFVMLAGETLPTLISLPPTALKPFGQFAVQLRKQNLPLTAITTVFGLTDARSGGGQTYKGLALRVGRRLAFAEMKAALGIRGAFEAEMARRGITVEEAKAPDEETGGDTTHDQDRY